MIGMQPTMDNGDDDNALAENGSWRTFAARFRWSKRFEIGQSVDDKRGGQRGPELEPPVVVLGLICALAILATIGRLLA
jgi:hypothetical protein